MPVIEQAPILWHSKPPQSAELDMLHPHCAGLRERFLFSEGQGFDTYGHFNSTKATGTTDLAWHNFEDGPCLRTNGTSAWLSVAHDAWLTPSNQLTLVLRLRRRDTGRRQIVVGKGDGNSAADTVFWIEFTSSDQIAFHVSNGTTENRFVSSLTLSDTSGVHTIVCTWDGATQRVYLDGVESTTTGTLSGTLNQSSRVLGFGRLGGLNGLYADVDLFDFILSDEVWNPETVLSYIENPYGAFYLSEQRYYTFASSSGQSEPLSGATGGDATATANLARTRLLSGATTGDASTQGNLSRARSLSGQTSGAATVAGALSRKRSMEGNSAGSATVDALLSRLRPLSGSVEGTSSLTATVAMMRALSGESEGEATLQGEIARTRALSGETGGAATVTGSLSSGNDVALSGTTQGQSVVSGAIARLRSLLGTTQGQATVAANAQRLRGLSGIAQGVATLGGQVNALFSLAGNAQGQATLAGVLSELEDVSYATRGSVPYPNEWFLLTSKTFGVTTSDFAPTDFIRRQSNGDVLIGGQTLLFGDDARWVHSRALKPFRGARLEGAKPDKEPEDEPVLIVAKNLRIVQASEYSGDDEIARVASNTALTIRFEASEELPQLAEGSETGEGVNNPGGGFQYVVTNYSTGAIVAQGRVSTHNSGTFTINLPAGLAAGSFGLYLNLVGVEKEFAWPLDYREEAGEVEFKPARYAWTHPTKGQLFYDPRYNIGARPYDLGDPIQKALLDERAALVAAKETLDRAEWTAFLITFNGDGSQVTSGGEYSALKVLSGAGAFIGNRNVHLGAIPGLHAWRDGAPSNSGGLETLCIEPRIRSIKGFCEEADGTFWATGHLAGRNGRTTFLFRLDADLNVTYQAYADLQGLEMDGEPLEREYSRKQHGAEAGSAIARDREELFVLTPLARLRLDPRKPAAQRLVVCDVGGFDFAQVTRLDGQQTTVYTVDPDRLSDDEKEALPRCDNYVRTTSQARFARGLSKHTHSNLVPFASAFYAIDESTEKEEAKTPWSESAEEGEDNTQQLVRLIDGGRSVREIWRKNQFDASRGHAAGAYSLFYGFNRLFEPRVLRVGKGIRQMGLKSPYIPLRCGSTVSADGTARTGWLIGRKMRGFKPLPGWYIAETTGDLAKIAFEKTPDNTGYSASIASLTAAGFALGAFPNFLVWLEDLRAWRTTSPQPENGETYLALDNSGDPVKYIIPNGVTLPYNLNSYCKLEFEAAAVSITQTPPPAQTCGKMDMAIVVDTTGSMGGAIDNVRKEIPLILADLEEASGGDYRAALVGADDEITVYVPFADNNGAAIEAALPDIFKAGGAEPTDEAIRTVLDNLPASARDGQQVTQVGDFSVPFRPDARKIIVLITDDMPNGLDAIFHEGVDDLNAHAMAVQAAAMGVRISAVYVPTGAAAGTEREVTPIMEDYADTSDGLFIRAQPSGQGVGQAISDIVNSCGGTPPPDAPADSVDGIVRPVACCDSAACVASTQADPYVIVLRYPEQGQQTEGAMSCASFAAKAGDANFRAAMAQSQVLWMALDDVEIDIPKNEGVSLTPEMLEELEKATIPMNYQRPNWFSRETKHFTIVAITDGAPIECSDLVLGPVA